MREYNEGDLVMCPDRKDPKNPNICIGTVIQNYKGEALVLDKAGYIHRVRSGELYEVQEDAV